MLGNRELSASDLSPRSVRSNEEFPHPIYSVKLLIFLPVKGCQRELPLNPDSREKAPKKGGPGKRHQRRIPSFNFRFYRNCKLRVQAVSALDGGALKGLLEENVDYIKGKWKSPFVLGDIWRRNEPPPVVIRSQRIRQTNKLIRDYEPHPLTERSPSAKANVLILALREEAQARGAHELSWLQ